MQSALNSGFQYFIISRSTDIAANPEIGTLASNIPAGTGITVTYDTAPPTAVITMPVLASTSGVISLSITSGTVSGDVSISNIQVAVANMTPTGTIWMDSSFNFTLGQTNPNFIAVTSSNTSTWSFTGVSGKLAGNQRYLIVAKAFAPSGLSQNVFTVGVSSVQVVIDTAPPNLTITVPNPLGTNSYTRAASGQSPSSLLAGTILDPLSLNSGVKDYQFLLSYVSAGTTFYYNGTTFTSTPPAVWPGNLITAGSWTYPLSISWPAASTSYLMKIQVRGEDNALSGSGGGPGNISVPTSTGTDIVFFNLDDIPPAGVITFPAANASVSSTVVHMTGTDTDDLSGVSLIQVEISTGTSPKSYYTGSGWTGAQTWITTTTTLNTWSYSIPSSALASGVLYYLRLQLTDNAGNSFTSITSTFTYDTQAPTVTISSPITGGFYSLVQVSTPFIGTAVDNGTNATGVSTVTLTLQDQTGSFSVFTSSGASGTPANWTYLPSNGYINGHQYQLTATAVDNAQNTNNTSVIFVYDVQAPTSSVTSPAPGYITSWTTISGKANDQIGAPAHLSGISTNGVSVAVKQVGGNWWDGGAFNGSNPLYSTSTFVGATSGTSSYTLPAALQNALTSGSTYFIISRSTDNAANAEFGTLAANIPAGTGITVVYDTAPPTAVITLPVLASTSGIVSFPTMSGTASGDVALSNVQIGIQNTGSGLWLDNTTNISVAQANPNYLAVT